MKIAVDGFGGDNSPQAVVKGCIMAVKKDDDLQILLTGNKELLEQLLAQDYYGDKISIIDAQSIITCEEDPILAIRKKKDSSLFRVLDLLKQGQADGGVSAGSSGAVLTGGIFVVGRIEGVQRPCLIPELPTLGNSGVALADCGANVDCKPEYLVQFARMGAAYMEAVHGVTNARIGLLSNGAEDTKGTELTKKAFELLKASDMNFLGNVEARYILSGDYDVIVCDGFDGNVALKSAEGTAGAVFSLLKKGIASSLRAKIGALLLKPVLKQIKHKMDYTEYGGAAFVGINKPLVKCHGSSDAKTICASVLQAKKMAEGGLCGKIEKLLATNDNE